MAFDAEIGIALRQTRIDTGVPARLRRAACILEEGWCQRAFSQRADGTPSLTLQSVLLPETRRVCLVGALVLEKHRRGVDISQSDDGSKARAFVDRAVAEPLLRYLGWTTEYTVVDASYTLCHFNNAASNVSEVTGLLYAVAKQLEREAA